MKGVKFEQANFDWGAPKGMENECSTLPAWRGREAVTNYPVSVSCWELSKEELEEVQRTGKIWLRVYGEGHPPVSLGTEDPWG